MKTILNNLLELNTLSQQEAYNLMCSIGAGEQNESHIASLLTVLMMRPITLQELTGFRDALLELCIPFNTEVPVVDLCGTGGDGKNTFNISTLSAFIVAGAGYKVAKHGNYGVSSASGSSNVMEYFGYKFTNDTDVLKKQLEQHNICFLHAPLFHPALKHVAQVRKQLGLKTFFNMLGPLVNPAKPQYRFTGVFSLELARLYHYLLQQGDFSYTVIHTLDGYDEISLTGIMKCYSNKGESLLTAEDLGFENNTQESLFGGDSVPSSAAIFMNILEGKGTKAQSNAVIANAAMAIQCAEGNLTFKDCSDKASESLQSGKALKAFKNLVA